MRSWPHSRHVSLFNIATLVSDGLEPHRRYARWDSRNHHFRTWCRPELIDCSGTIHRSWPIPCGRGAASGRTPQPNSLRARSEMAMTAGLRSFLSTVIA